MNLIVFFGFSKVCSVIYTHVCIHTHTHTHTHTPQQLQRSNRVDSNCSTCHSVLNLQKDYQVSFNLDDKQSATIVIEAVQSNPVIETFRHYKLACPTTEVSSSTSLMGNLYHYMLLTHNTMHSTLLH